MIELLGQNPWFSVLANSAGLVSFILGIVFYFKSKEKFAMAYFVAEKTLIDQPAKLPFDLDLPVSIAGTAVQRLTRTFVLIRNNGNKLIEPNDNVGLPSLAVGSASTILNFEVVMSDDPGSQFSLLTTATNSLDVRMNFIRPKEGFVIKVDHTGAQNELFVNWRTKIGGPIRKINLSARVALWLMLAVLSMPFLGVSVILALEQYLPSSPDRPSLTNTDLFGAILGSTLIGMMIWLSGLVIYGLCNLIIRMWRRFALGRAHSPTSFEIFSRASANAKG